MFIGHFAPALIAAAQPRATRLGPMFAAAQLVDIAFAAFVLGGIESMRITPGITAMVPFDLYYMPYTHSLIGAVEWGLGLGALVYIITRRAKAAALIALVVVSHWFLDLLVHTKDLTLFGSPPKLGFGLWNYPLVAMPLEIGLIAGAFVYYLRRTRPKSGGNGRMGLLAGVLILFQAINWFGPQESEMSSALPLTMLAAFTVLIGAAWWAGHNRVLVIRGNFAS
jgi:membrane-bound metal-dependent hydrolase YbcI (DUF457 family)